MPFRFSLDAVLRARVLQEDREERMLQQILRELAEARRMLRQIQDEIARKNSGRALWTSELVAGRELHLAFGEIEELRRCVQEVAAQLEKLEQMRKQQTAAYQAARRDRELLTEMREQQRLAYNCGVAAREQKALDDIFGARFSRN